jgi:hypothetical protein
MEQTVLNIWGYILLLSPLADENLTKFQIETVCEQILVWCNREDIPVKLERTIATWIVEFNKIDTSVPSNIQSIKEGDTTIQYAGVSDSNVSSQRIIDRFAEYFRPLLNSYRRFY